MKPLVTIGIPAYNAEKHIEQCVKSALAQTWSPLEVIVVDDGSNDGTLKILEQFGTKIRVITQEHMGGNEARNRILKEAKGEWLQYLDADDYLLPDKIEKQLPRSSEAAIIYSEVLIEEQNGKPKPLAIDTDKSLWEQWISWQLPQTGAVLWRIHSLRHLGGWDAKMSCCQEHELYFRALKAELNFEFVKETGAVYRIWSESTVSRKNPAQVVEVKTELILKAKEWLEQEGKWNEELEKTAGQACLEMARTLAKTDLEVAEEYFDARYDENLIFLRGPAAPLKYRIFLTLFGFKNAERLARLLRP